MEKNNINNEYKNKVSKKISALTPILALLTFLILGFTKGLWHPGWVAFLAIPLVELVLSLFKRKGKAKFVTLSVIISIIGYLLLGFCLNAWHPGWLIFFLIPIVSIIVD